ncbi:MAG: hypothetical protein ABJO30_10525, partial [Hyphomicrobiales bacterium]
MVSERVLKQNKTISWRVRLALVILLVLAVVTVSITNRLLTDRFTETTRNRAELRLALYSGNLRSELRQSAIVPQLLARDPTLIGALNSADYSRSTQRLISFVEEIGAASLVLLDSDGRTVAATDRNHLGESHRNDAYFVNALRGQGTIFTVVERGTGGYAFHYSRRVQSGNEVLGVISVEVDLQKFERAWAGISDAVIVENSEGQIILATEPRWRGGTEDEALARQNPQSAIERAIRVTADWTALPADAYLQGEAVMRLENRVAFRGWRIVSFTTYASVRE